MTAAAAFFDLDRTVIRRSSALALAGWFRRRGVIGRRALVKAAAWQLVFAARGAGGETVRRAAEDGLMVLRGFPRDELRRLVADALPATLLPLVYADAVELVDRHRSRGERTYLVSATLQEIVEAIAQEVGIDEAVGTLCEVEGGVYTGRPLRALYAERKADVVREIAVRDGLDLSASTAYSDSHTDLPFLEVVGHPVAVNPDRALRRIATERAWPVLRFRRSLALDDAA
ncbi:MAG: HAD-IB family hydrolase [Thermoleophilia bacterium]|nr:HAD-IB family hydrolase [Thermoleophilia bacterium]